MRQAVSPARAVTPKRRNPSSGPKVEPSEQAVPQSRQSPPISPVPAVLPAPPVPTRQVFYHRGVSIEICRTAGRYAFVIAQDGHALHTCRPDFATPQSAERAARQFVDDALGAFEVATQALEA